jgi:hypothetical protein
MRTPERLKRAAMLYRAGLKDSAILVAALSVMTIIGGLLTLWPSVANSGYWTNVAAAPPFALLVIVAGEIPFSIRAGLARCRNYRESIRRSASSVLDLLWLLEQDWQLESTSTEGNQKKVFRDPSAVRLGVEESPAMTLETYSTYLSILAGHDQSFRQRSQQDDSPSGSVRTYLVFNRLREDLSDLALTLRQLEQEPTALLTESIDEALQNTANLSAEFISSLVRDQNIHDMRARSKAMADGVLRILQVVEAELPDWALPRYTRDHDRSMDK